MNENLKNIADIIVAMEKSKNYDSQAILDLVKNLSMEDLIEIDDYLSTILDNDKKPNS